MTEQELLQRTIELSQESYDQGRFPAGAVMVDEQNNIVAESVSGKWPAVNHHGEASVIDQTMEKYNVRLEKFTLYTTMEPCLMCLGKAYWSGLDTIIYIIPAELTDPALAFEGKHDLKTIFNTLNRPISISQDKTRLEDALAIYKKWEAQIKSK